MKIIIVGGVAGGATAAARIRRNTESAEIILFEKGAHISYANCGLPYYIGGVIKERDRLFVQTPKAFGKRFNIDVRMLSEVTAIDRERKEVTVRTADGKMYTESYDKLLLSPGASPVRPPLKGIDSEGIFTLRNVADTDRIKQYLNEKPVKRAVIVGGGFIGLEMAENLVHAGVEVSVVEMADQVMGPIDYSMASFVHEHLTRKGVRLYLSQAVESFERTDAGLSVAFKSGIHLRVDMVILSIGVRAETRLASDAELRLGEMKGIYVDEYLRTSDENIYAVGDNEQAALFTGINVRRVKLTVYVLVGLFAAIAGILNAARTSAGLYTSGEGYEMDAIAAVVLGGTSMTGGVGRLAGSVIGDSRTGGLKVKKVLLDFDIGTEIDDAIALAYLLANPECELVGITTSCGESIKRAEMASVLCRAAGKKVPIHAGCERPLLIPQMETTAPQAAILPHYEHDTGFAPNTAIPFMQKVIRENCWPWRP